MTAATTRPIDIVTRFSKAMEQGDLAAALALVSAYINPPPFETAKGPAGIQAVLQPFFAPVLENRFDLLRMAADGATVFVERLDRYRLPDNRRVQLPVTGRSRSGTGLSPVGAIISMSRR